MNHRQSADELEGRRGGTFVSSYLTRRGWMATAGAGLVATAAPAREEKREPFRFMFNTSTIRGQDLAPPMQVDIAAKAGYHAIEPWIPDIEKWLTSGGKLKDLGKRIADSGMTCESAIGFAAWI